MDSYSDLFDQRGSAYDTAMRLFPDARAEEFAQVVKAVDLQAGMVIGDVPAGGSYLRTYLPAACLWLGHEPCASFTNHATDLASRSKPLLPLPWANETLDVAISLAGVHHLEDKVPLFKEIHRVTKPGGQFVLSDVASGSAPAHFLDGYIGANNSTGHEGLYLDASTEEDLRVAGWAVQKVTKENYDWVFDTANDMARFCHLLFDLKGNNIDATRDAIYDDLGVRTRSDGQIGMNWSLLTIVSTKAAEAEG